VGINKKAAAPYGRVVHRRPHAVADSKYNLKDEKTQSFFPDGPSGRDSHPEAKKFSDVAPMLAEKKYLRTIFYCHQCKGTLDTVPEGHEITVMDLPLGLIWTIV
jgi:hypothetical protein